MVYIVNMKNIMGKTLLGIIEHNLVSHEKILHNINLEILNLQPTCILMLRFAFIIILLAFCPKTEKENNKYTTLKTMPILI